MTTDLHTAPQRLDLTLTRTIDAPRSLVWRAWTTPEHLKRWWAPKPWVTLEVEMELKPGGAFRTVMRGPDGPEHPTLGIFLEIVPEERIVFTDLLEPGWRPAATSSCGAPFTAIISFADLGGKTRYSALVMHKSEADRRLHEEMGFQDGWGTCADQLAAVAQGLGRAG